MMLFVLFGYLVFVKRDFTGNLKIRLVFSFLGIFTPVVTAFPLALGYSGINVPNRCEFVLDMSIIITAFNLALDVYKRQAISSLPDKQAKRIYAHFILGMTKKDIARAEGVDEKVVRCLLYTSCLILQIIT